MCYGPGECPWWLSAIMFFGPNEFDADEMGYAMSRLETESGVGSSSVSHRSSEHLAGLDQEINQITKLKSSPHQRYSRVVPGRHELPVSTVRMLAGRESNFSGRGGRFSAADRCHMLSRYLPVKGPWLVDQMNSRAYVSQFSTDGSLFIAGFQVKFFISLGCFVSSCFCIDFGLNVQGSHIRIYNVDKGWKVQKDILAKSLRWTVTDTSLSPDQRNLV